MKGTGDVVTIRTINPKEKSRKHKIPVGLLQKIFYIYEFGIEEYTKFGDRGIFIEGIDCMTSTRDIMNCKLLMIQKIAGVRYGRSSNIPTAEKSRECSARKTK